RPATLARLGPFSMAHQHSSDPRSKPLCHPSLPLAGSILMQEIQRRLSLSRSYDQGTIHVASCRPTSRMSHEEERANRARMRNKPERAFSTFLLLLGGGSFTVESLVWPPHCR